MTERSERAGRFLELHHRGGFAFAALGAVVEAAREFLEDGTYTFWQRAAVGAASARSAFTS